MESSKPPLTRKIVFTDLYRSINEVSRSSFARDRGLSKWQLFLRSSHILNPSVLCVLMLLGTFAALIGFLIDFVSVNIREARLAFASTDSVILNYFIWVSFSLFFAFIAASAGHWMTKDAEGSGLPELKTILSGVSIIRYLSFQALCAKVIGLICAIASGLSIGYEGPFVHISAIIANKLCSLPFFRHLKISEAFFMQILAAGVAAGISATFGAPIGGVLFSIETTATYYVIGNLWKGFFCAIWCAIVYKLLEDTQLTNLIAVTRFEPFRFNWEILAFFVMGIAFGALGAFFVWCYKKLYLFRKSFKFDFIRERFAFVFLVTLVVATMTFPAEFLRGDDKTTVNTMFATHHLNDKAEAIWGWPTIGLSLLVFSIVKFIVTILSISCPVPCGVFIPTFTCGAVLGRLFGYIVNIAFSTQHIGLYAVVGAASFTASVTHTVSIAVIVFELTGQIHYLIPMLVGVLTSYAVANTLHMSYYDVILACKHLPFLPEVKTADLYASSAFELMGYKALSLNVSATYGDISIKLQESPRDISRLPILDDSGNLVADVNTADLRRHLQTAYMRTATLMSIPAKARMEAYFDRIQHLGSLTQRDQVEVYQEHKDEILEDPQISLFWRTKVEFNREELWVDDAPLSVPGNTPLSKVHFLFLMLGLSQLYVTSRGQFVGTITREAFLQS
jgi:chloride channel 2